MELDLRLPRCSLPAPTRAARAVPHAKASGLPRRGRRSEEGGAGEPPPAAKEGGKGTASVPRTHGKVNKGKIVFSYGL